MKRSPVITVGLALVVGCTGAAKTTEGASNLTPPAEQETSAAPSEDAAVPELEADAPQEDPAPAPGGDLPTWDDVPSNHPPGATNPPRPALTVTPDGRCYKRWVSPMVAARAGGDKVADCREDCGTEIQCPERAAEMLKAHQEQ